MSGVPSPLECHSVCLLHSPHTWTNHCRVREHTHTHAHLTSLCVKLINILLIMCLCLLFSNVNHFFLGSGVVRVYSGLVQCLSLYWASRDDSRRWTSATICSEYTKWTGKMQTCKEWCVCMCLFPFMISFRVLTFSSAVQCMIM